MSTFIKATLFSAMLFCACAAKAQTEDYVVTPNKDTIKCHINTPLIGSKSYQTNITQEATKIKPASIREYYIKRKNLNERSVYISGKEKPLFMTVIENGKISLYQLVYYSGRTQTTEWYIGKQSDTVTALKTTGLLFINKSRKERKDTFKEMLVDNKAVYDKYINDDKFDFDQLQGLIHLYNTGFPLVTNEPENVKTDDAY